MRDRAHEIKEEVIDRLDFYLEKLETNVTANGGKVFWARDGKEASDYILEVARRIRAKTVVKSKSMTTEEIGLVAHTRREPTGAGGDRPWASTLFSSRTNGLPTSPHLRCTRRVPRSESSLPKNSASLTPMCRKSFAR